MEHLVDWFSLTLGPFLALVLAPAKKSKIQSTRKHSSRMPAAPLGKRTCFIMKKFEYARGSLYSEIEVEQVWRLGLGVLVQDGGWGLEECLCMVRSNASWVMVTYGKRDRTENITFATLSAGGNKTTLRVTKIFGWTQTKKS